MVLCIEERRRRFWWDFAIANRSGARRRESTFTQDWQEASTRLLRETAFKPEDSNALDGNTERGKVESGAMGRIFFLEKLLEAACTSGEDTPSESSWSQKHLQERLWPQRKLVDITADDNRDLPQ